MRPKHKIAKLESSRQVVGLGSLGLLGLLTLMIVMPTCYNASANTNNLSVDDTFSSSLATNVSTYVRSSIAIGLSRAVEMVVTPQAEGAFSTSTAKLQVITNNVTGYKVYLTTTDGTGKLNPTNPKVEAVIQPVEGIMTSENYRDGHLDSWGYSISNTDAAMNEYQAIPQAGAAPVISTDQASSDDSYTLGFAVATSVDLPAGLYTNSVLASAVANPIEVRSLTDITYMQEMTSEICQVSFENETKRLIDIRDNKSYWVAKLKDGNCWMTQNLALDITEDYQEKLTASNTDIPEDWKATLVVTMDDIPKKGASGDSDGANLSWNLGKYVVKNPTESVLCQTTTSLAACSDSLEDVNLRADDEYDAHYLIGNYYQWRAATAGSSGDNSLCPKGWKLPLSGDGNGSNNSKNGSFYNLLNAYGLTTATSSMGGLYQIILPNDKILSSAVKPDQYDIVASPVYFNRSGSVNPMNGYVNVGSGGTYVSSVYANAGIAYYMSISGTDVNPSNAAYSFRHARSIRCLAR